MDLIGEYQHLFRGCLSTIVVSIDWSTLFPFFNVPYPVSSNSGELPPPHFPTNFGVFWCQMDHVCILNIKVHPHVHSAYVRIHWDPNFSSHRIGGFLKWGVFPVIIHFERWDFPRNQPSIFGNPSIMGNFHRLILHWYCTKKTWFPDVSWDLEG